MVCRELQTNPKTPISAILANFETATKLPSSPEAEIKSQKWQMVTGQACGLGGAKAGGSCEPLKLELINGTDFYPGQDIKVRWTISDPACAGSLIQFKNGVNPGGGTMTENINAGGQTGIYVMTLTKDDRVEFPYFMHGKILSGKCLGDVSNDVIFNALRPEIPVISLSRGSFYDGDTLTISWTGKPPTPNKLPITITLVNENKTFGVEMVSAGVGTIKDLEMLNSGSFTYKIPAGTVKRNSIVAVCYDWNDSERPSVVVDPSDWRDTGQAKKMSCGKSAIFSFGGVKVKTSWLGNMGLANIWSALTNFGQ
ncbi:MAG: hypothetical protein NTV48_03625 [Candidatus Vogelbacteria bacterium]|nr:hypothetical protein [Candidatus Vogelbacteria bacterium]